MARRNCVSSTNETTIIPEKLYCEDKALADYLKARINKTSEFTYSFEEDEYISDNLMVAEDIEIDYK